MSAEHVGERTFIDKTMNVCVYTKTLADKMTPISLAEEEYSSMITIQKNAISSKVKTMTWPSM